MVFKNKNKKNEKSGENKDLKFDLYFQKKRMAVSSINHIHQELKFLWKKNVCLSHH